MDGFLTDEQKERIAYARKFFPWANKQYETWAGGGKAILPPFTEEEIWWTLERCARWQLNPSDNNQVQIWKDKNGIVVEPAYQVIVNWLETFGPHSAVRYYRVVGDALKDEGSLDPRDLIYKAEVVFYREVREAISAGLDQDQAMKLATHTGIGRVAAKDYITDDGKEKAYSAPSGRTPADKAKKRALIDLANDLGTPTDEEYQAMSVLNRAITVTPEMTKGAVGALWEEPTKKPEALPAPESASVVDAEFEPAPQDAPPAPEPPAETEAESLARQTAAVAQAKAAEERPYTAARLREQLRKSFAGRAAFEYPSDGERNKSLFTVNKNIELAFAGEGQEAEKRHAVLFFLTSKQSSKELLDGELESLRRWLAVSQNADGEWAPDPLAVAEARAAYVEGLKEAGQTSF
jgi:hypothetical protein